MSYFGREQHKCKCFLCEKGFMVEGITYYLYIRDELLIEGVEICLECAKIDDVKEIALKIFERAKRLKDEASDVEGEAWGAIQALNEGNNLVCEEGMVYLPNQG